MLGAPRAVRTFAAVMRDQVDLRIEGRNLDTFRQNFGRTHGGGGATDPTHGGDVVDFPRPVSGWVTAHVLVESLEEGTPVADYCTDDSERGRRRRAAVARPLLLSFLKMVFADNFVHCDLHPGNILVREVTGPDGGRRHAVVFLDAGLATSLGPGDRRNLMELFRAVVLDRGAEAGRLMVDRARYERCSDVPGCTEAFAAGVGGLVREFHASRQAEGGLTLHNVKIGSLLGRMLDLCRVHGVEIDPGMANIVLSTLVLEGLGRSLDPELNLMDCAVPFVLKGGKF